MSQIVHTGRDIVCCRGEKHDEQYLAFSIHTAGVKMRKVSPRMKGSGRLKSMNVVGFGAAGVLLPPLILLLRSCSCHPLTSEDRKNRPFSTFKIVPKLDSSASVPPHCLTALVSPSRRGGSLMSRECRSPPSSKVKARPREREREGEIERGAEGKSRSEASLPFHSFLNSPMMRRPRPIYLSLTDTLLIPTRSREYCAGLVSRYRKMVIFSFRIQTTCLKT